MKGHCNAPFCEMERRADAVAGRPAYRRVLRLLFLAARLRAVFFGTFAPAARASERPIAIACLRLLTVRPERPLFKVPALRFFIARSTVFYAFFEYFRALRAMIFLPLVPRFRSSAHLRSPVSNFGIEGALADF